MTRSPRRGRAGLGQHPRILGHLAVVADLDLGAVVEQQARGRGEPAHEHPRVHRVVEPQPAAGVGHRDHVADPADAAVPDLRALHALRAVVVVEHHPLGHRHRAGRPGDDRHLGRRVRRRTGAGSAAGCRRGRRRRPAPRRRRAARRPRARWRAIGSLRSGGAAASSSPYSWSTARRYQASMSRTPRTASANADVGDVVASGPARRRRTRCRAPAAAAASRCRPARPWRRGAPAPRWRSGRRWSSTSLSRP